LNQICTPEGIPHRFSLNSSRSSAPTQLIFIISLVIAIIGVLAALGVLAFIPLASVWIMLIAYIVLAAGCMMRGA